MNTTHIRHMSALLPLILLATETTSAAVKVIDLGGNQFMATFDLTPPSNATTVHVAGSFNQWNPTANQMTGPDANGCFSVEIPLVRGRYEYKFVVNGDQWMTDPDNEQRIGPNQNAVLLAGVDPQADSKATELRSQLQMPGLKTHPPEISDYFQELWQQPTAKQVDGINAWFSNNPSPYFTKSSVTFLFYASGLKAAHVAIIAPTGRLGYTMEPMMTAPHPDGAMLYGVTVALKNLPARSAYLIELVEADRTRRIVDPHAWSVTSRNGRPAGRLVGSSPRTGRIKLLGEVRPTAGNLKPRDVYVYLPPGYDPAQKQRYPVVYLHDGQNCWDDPNEPFGHGGWSINVIADALIASGDIEPFIAVGIANTSDRLAEYGPGSDILSGETHAYLQFIAKQLKPMIDKQYRTKTGAGDTSLIGSSMGGAISFQGVMLMPDVFGNAACLSTAFLFKDESGRGYTEMVEQLGKQPVRIYLDSGTGGQHQDGAPATRAMVELLATLGWQRGDDLVHFQDEGADHNERAWRARVDRPLRFLFAK